MAGRYANLLLVPDEGGRTSQFRVRLWPLHTLVISAILILALFAGAGISYVKLYYANVDAGFMLRENLALREELIRMGDRVALLNDVVRSNVHLANESRLLAGLPPYSEDVALVGVGGVTSIDLPGAQLGVSPAVERTVEVYRDRLEQLSRQLAFQEESFVEVRQIVEANRDRLDHIPTVRPIRGPHYVSSVFGRRRDPFTGRPAHHNGIDFAAQRGTPFHATADGVVMFVGRDGGLGKIVKIDHGGGYVTIFAHADRILVKKGQEVHRGDVIGEVGNTGRSTGDHLHYEIQQGGRPVNPRGYLLDDALGG